MAGIIGHTVHPKILEKPFVFSAYVVEYSDRE